MIKPMRLFVAIPLDSGMKKSLRGIQDELRRRGVRGRYTAPENLHLTLAFIGEYPDPDAVLEAMTALRFPPVKLRLSGLGSFGSLWWAGLAEDERLSALVRQLRHALADRAIPFDRKRFLPHITLLRQAAWRGDPELGTVPVPPAEMTAERVSLMLSTRGRSGMLYTELGAVRAQEGPH